MFYRCASFHVKLLDNKNDNNIGLNDGAHAARLVEPSAAVLEQRHLILDLLLSGTKNVIFLLYSLFIYVHFFLFLCFTFPIPINGL